MPDNHSPFRRTKPRWSPLAANRDEQRTLPGLKVRFKGPFRTSFFAFIVAAICLGVLYAWVTSTRDEAVENLAQAVERAAASGGVDALDLAASTTFAWDTLIVLPPYTDPQSLEQALGSALGPAAMAAAEDVAIGRRDDVTVLGFVRDGSLVEVIAFPRNRGDFAVADRPQAFPYDRALFYVEPMPGQADWLNVWPANP